MQLSSILSRAKIDLRLGWRSRDENKLGDALTNGDFSSVTMSKRVDLNFSDLPLDMIHNLYQTFFFLLHSRASDQALSVIEV